MFLLYVGYMDGGLPYDQLNNYPPSPVFIEYMLYAHQQVHSDVSGCSVCLASEIEKRYMTMPLCLGPKTTEPKSILHSSLKPCRKYHRSSRLQEYGEGSKTHGARHLHHH